MICTESDNASSMNMSDAYKIPHVDVIMSSQRRVSSFFWKLLHITLDGSCVHRGQSRGGRRAAASWATDVKSYHGM